MILNPRCPNQKDIMSTRILNAKYGNEVQVIEIVRHRLWSFNLRRYRDSPVAVLSKDPLYLELSIKGGDKNPPYSLKNLSFRFLTQIYY